MKYPGSGFAGHGVVGWVLLSEVLLGGVSCAADVAVRFVMVRWAGDGWLPVPVPGVDASACTSAPSRRVSMATGHLNGSKGGCRDWIARPQRLSEAAAVSGAVPLIDGFDSARILKQPVTR